MDIEAALAECEATTRQHDPDRYHAALFADEERRAMLFALYAFNYEIARVAERVHEPMLGEIRLQWWRETMQAARDMHPRAHNVAHALVELFARTGLPPEEFEAMIDARGFDISDDTFPDLVSLERYADATSGGVMRLAARILNEDSEPGLAAREAGIAYGLAGILRTIPYHAARRKLFLPLDLLREQGLDAEDVFAGRGGDGLNTVIARVAIAARTHMKIAKKHKPAPRTLPALMPASLCPLYLSVVTARGFQPFHTIADVPLYRRQIAMMGAAIRGRV